MVRLTLPATASPDAAAAGAELHGVSNPVFTSMIYHRGGSEPNDSAGEANPVDGQRR